MRQEGTGTEKSTPHDPLWLQLTSQHGTTIANPRENENQFREWLKKNHIQFDKEIAYEEVQKDLEDGRTSYERVLIGTLRFKVGDYVQISNKQFRPIGRSLLSTAIASLESRKKKRGSNQVAWGLSVSCQRRQWKLDSP
mmetsp:Transcript_33349/g.54087  ORF Transcript_33349/g.54087 Transcript_33349/m.54087 type:complete len:139 (-) Transcript_33349:105-521(-)